MSRNKSILILGGTGFVGRAISEKYLNNNWNVIIPTRILNAETAKEKLILHGFNKVKLQKFINANQIYFITRTDLSNRKLTTINYWHQSFQKLNIPLCNISRVINLISDTSGTSNEIIKSNIEVLDSIFTLVRYLKYRNKEVLFCNMGSTAERKNKKNLPPYEIAKKIVRQKIKESGICDYHFVANYIKGKGEQKIKLVAPFLWKKLRISHRWLFGFRVSIVDVDNLAEIIYHIIEDLRVISNMGVEKLPIEVNITSGELIFGEMIKNLLPQDQRKIPKTIFPYWFDKYFLKIYALFASLLKPKNQLIRRLADFAEKGSTDIRSQENLKLFKTAEEIKKFAEEKNYAILEKSPNLIIIDKDKSVMYALREKNRKELIKIVQKAI